MFVLQRHKLLLRLISCSCTGLKEMKIVEHYFYQVGLEGSGEAGNVKKQSIIPTVCFLIINISSHFMSFLVKAAAEMNLSHMHAPSEIRFMIPWVQRSNLGLEGICQVSVY